ncbi:hypothetical protein [Mucilaginibacter endophyticus]|uniref:hypothetical protein n=1 Tax=Mucilaginibacter endophyticus TaxID=2675003 RepID=UPI000E0CDE68|nr:hypothetical protein [Mucilaginibacter endophyticus]
MNPLKIKDRGNKLKERIIFKPDSDSELGYFILFIVEKVKKDGFSGKPSQVFWFPDINVKKNDIIVVYTKSGTPSVRENQSGNSTYFFYWDLPSEQFSSNLIPVLVEAQGWIALEDSEDDIET